MEVSVMNKSFKIAVVSAVAVLAVDCWAPVAASTAASGIETGSTPSVNWTADVQGPAQQGIGMNPSAGVPSQASPNLVISGVIINLGITKPVFAKIPCWMPFSKHTCL
jgi:hypothetical protein